MHTPPLEPNQQIQHKIAELMQREQDRKSLNTFKQQLPKKSDNQLNLQIQNYGLMHNMTPVRELQTKNHSTLNVNPINLASDSLEKKQAEP